jgi:hypothetical protein
MKNSFPYIIIGVLITIIVLQWKQCISPPPKEIVRIDTVVKITEIRQIIPAETLFIASERDTMWKESIIYVPDSTYKGLLRQYEALGNQHFATNYYESKFPIEDYGYVKVRDTIKANRLMGTGMETFLNIPERMITIQEYLPPTSEMYIGGGTSINQMSVLNSIYFGGLYKNKKNNMFGVNVSYSPQQGISYGVSYYTKLNIKL